MEDLTREFIHTLARGNDGKGIQGEVRIRRGARTSVLDVDVAAEALNNALVRIGFKLARRRLIPDAAAVADIARAMRGTHAAFGKDLTAFMESAAR